MNNNNSSESTISTPNSSQTTLFSLADFDKKKIEVSFTSAKTSSDGGLMLLREVDKQIDLIGKLAACVKDDRHQGYVQHSIDSMLRQRIMQVAAGYEDANDCDTLKDDEIIKLCANGTKALSSQPTMCRLENNIGSTELLGFAKVFVDNFIESYKNPPKFIILDPDDTDVTAYGQQQSICYNGYYNDYCFLPLHIYEGVSGRLVATILKPGRRSKSIEVYAILKRIISYLREH